MRPLYAAPPVDEVRLAHRAAAAVEALGGLVPDSAYLRELSREQDTDFATAVFYQALRASDAQGDFIRAVEAQAVAPREAPEVGVKLFIIPAMFYQEHPEVGGDGAHIAEVARACGIDAQVIPTQSKHGIAANVPLIRDTLAAETSARIWLMSLSKGSAELRYVFAHHADAIPMARIEAWFNVGGLPNGCHLVDLMLASAMRRLRTRALCSVMGVDFPSFEEFGTQNPEWRRPLSLPDTLRVVNVVGAPLAGHVQKALQARYSRLKHLGPNDGMVVLAEALWLPGAVYPVWGADHFLRGAPISPLLYRLFGYLLDVTAQNASSLDSARQTR